MIRSMSQLQVTAIETTALVASTTRAHWLLEPNDNVWVQKEREGIRIGSLGFVFAVTFFLLLLYFFLFQ